MERSVVALSEDRQWLVVLEPPGWGEMTAVGPTVKRSGMPRTVIRAWPSSGRLTVRAPSPPNCGRWGRESR